MATSQEFLKKIVEDRGLSTREKIAELVGAVAGDGEIHFATTIVRHGLLPEKELVTLLNTYGDQEEKAGNTAVSENVRFGTKLAEKGLASSLEIWTAIGDQEKARSEGTEKSIDWFLSRSGSLDLGESFEVLSEMGRKVVVCGDCGHREILPESAASSKPACPECHGIMKEAKKEEAPPKEAKKGGDPLLGKELGGCIMESLLGKGGMGAVYKARHLALNKTVAVKVLSGALGAPSAKKRFLREARTAARLEHSNVVLVYDTGTEEDTYYIVMQYVEGESASGRVKREGPLPVDMAVEIILEAAKGVGAAHKMGMIHRDIKPDNIMIDKEGSIKVADFGLAKELGQETTALTMTGQAMGTPSYMSPEQARDAATVTVSSDIYSLGATLYTLLSGKPPFTGSSVWAVVSAAMTEPAPDIRELRPDVPDALADFLLQTMEKEPEKRPTDMAAFMDNLLAIRRKLEGGQAETSSPAPAGAVHLTLDDYKTPPPGKEAGPRPPRTPELLGPTLDDLPTPATISPDRRGTPWLVPTVVVAVIVLAAVIVGALVVPGLRNGSREPEPKDVGFDAGKGKTPDSVPDEELEAEAAEALKKAKSEADGFLSRDEFVEALTVYNAFPSRFEKTQAWVRSGEEKGRVFNLALGRLKSKIGEVERRFTANRASEANQLAAEVARIIDGLKKGFGEKTPESLTGLQASLEQERKKIDSRLGVEDWLDELEPRLKKLGAQEESQVLERLGKLAGTGPPALRQRAEKLLHDLKAHRRARDAAVAGAAFEKAMDHAKKCIDGGDPDGAQGALQPYRDSSSTALKAQVREMLEKAEALRGTLARFDEARGGVKAVTARGNFADIKRTKKVLEGFKGSEFKFVRDRAEEAIRELDGVKASLEEKLRGKGYVFMGPFEGEVGADDPSDGNDKREVKLGSFAIGVHEVSCAEYAEFVSESGRTPPQNWSGDRYPEGLDEHPVTHVSAADAEAYCAWLAEKTGLKACLPMEEEWEVAAGFDGEGIRTYPWGPDFDESAANLNGDGPSKVSSFERDKSPSGAFDMAGNVCEWVKTAEGGYAARGGCFDDGGSPVSAHCAFRTELSGREKSRRIGFRVALDLK